jgi:hypothetical protein
MLAKNKILGRIFGRYIHYHVITVSRAPFDFLISVPKLRTRIIGGIANTKEGELCRRIDEILSIGKVVRAQPILITEGQDQPEKGILCIRSDNTTKIKNPADLIASVK